MRYLKEGEFPHLLLTGVQGSGKSSISNALVAEFKLDPIDVLNIDVSKETSVDVVRDRIFNFVQTYANSAFKVVQLEEMDYMSPNAQGALRVMMSEYSDYVRFICTCNYANKIIPALKSRMTHYEFKAPSFEDSAVLVANILVGEGIDFEVELLERYITAYYPDLRALIGALQENSYDGKLHEPTTEASSDYKFQLVDLLGAGNIGGLRKVVCDNVGREEYEDVYRFMYENLHKAEGFDAEKTEKGIVLIAEYLYRHSLVADPEINFAAMCIRLNSL